MCISVISSLFQKADAVGMDLTMTQERAKAVDFTVPFLDSKLVIVSKEVIHIMIFLLSLLNEV